MTNFNNNYSGGFYAYNNGFAPSQQYTPQREPRFSNPLTEEEKKLLRGQKGLSLIITDEEQAKAKCTHKENKHFSTRENPDGTVTCYICGTTFTPVDYPVEQAESVINDTINLLETIKLFNLDMPDQVTTEYFQMIPFLKKAPEMYDLALKNFQSYEKANPLNQYNTSNQYFGIYDSIGAPGYMYNPNMGMNMGMGNYQYNQPMGMAQPQVAPMPMGSQPVGGFGYVDNGMAPGMAPVQMAPMAQPQAQPAPITQPPAGQTVASDTVTQTKTFAL